MTLYWIDTDTTYSFHQFLGSHSIIINLRFIGMSQPIRICELGLQNSIRFVWLKQIAISQAEIISDKTSCVKVDRNQTRLNSPENWPQNQNRSRNIFHQLEPINIEMRKNIIKMFVLLFRTRAEYVITTRHMSSAYYVICSTTLILVHDVGLFPNYNLKFNDKNVEW